MSPVKSPFEALAESPRKGHAIYELDKFSISLVPNPRFSRVSAMTAAFLLAP